MGEKLTLLLLGLIQGLTDIFPISSTGHLAILHQVLNIPSFNLSLAAGLHSGSLVTITIFFQKELKELWKNLLDSFKIVLTKRSSLSAEKIIPYLYAISLIPVALEGLALRGKAQFVFDQKLLPVLLLIVNGGFILVIALITHGERTIKELTWKDFLLIGMIQGLAVLPGISRLGLVLGTSLFYRLKWQEALKFTFILSIPVVMGALIVETGSIIQTLQNDPTLTVSFLGGSLFAGLGSWYSLNILTSELLERRKLALFGYYCLLLGSFSFTYLFFWK